MVSKITIFEPHFDGAQFGPASIETGGDGAGTVAAGSENDSTLKPRRKKVLQGATVFVVMFVLLWVVFSRLVSEDEDDEA